MWHPKERWRGVPVIMTSNKLPSVLREPKQYLNEEDYRFKERKNDYAAFMSRVKLVEMKKSHHNWEDFPYTEDDLARYMLEYITKNKNVSLDETMT